MRVPLLLCLALGASCVARADTATPPPAPQPTSSTVIVVGDLTPEGRKLPPPSPDKPVYYVPLVRGYQELGSAAGTAQPPAPRPVAETLARALAKQGYVVATDAHPPTQLIVISWGPANPDAFQNDDTPADEDYPGIRSRIGNSRQLLTLVGAHQTKINDPFPFSDWTRAQEAARENRYYVILCAYEYEPATRKDMRGLWRTQISVAADNTTPDAAIPFIITTGAPAFGRETKTPLWVRPSERRTQVDIGDATVVPDAPPAKK